MANKTSVHCDPVHHRNGATPTADEVMALYPTIPADADPDKIMLFLQLVYPLHYVAAKGRLCLFVGKSPSDPDCVRFNTVLDDEGNSIFAKRVLGDMEAAATRKAATTPDRAGKAAPKTAGGEHTSANRRSRKTKRQQNRPRPN
ncbi:hypothetical protein pmac_cds_891 [Pandoravirus macleodensis]|uniref:Uncharacterized protein n=1 Tax=Pandoravirus macleodensis TaxID=2107707 RepID=A0A2U7UGD2_9VIRU|nr:hypothetical protein pmac_cds_891 [Pandoravirus macleodensis]AVK77579.1 hypothetical protein pmac_cds_891 [Pandoravirus macleodensis]